MVERPDEFADAALAFLAGESPTAGL
jgi:hypothetical protein